ncbi:Glycerol-3-phosphate acyltransferase, chloroplastic [Vitis vinifera]|uniref:Glycerol-3-phosphate acyltransferase, chloroplastic n=1 Tax=Vitis vinifera TaxID=29760 RepID=A0A438GKJ1_VITVI|nr:Glycerol-3-phosphate acyltransferase, chloroplastic [Vitis vinifera]
MSYGAAHESSLGRSLLIYSRNPAGDKTPLGKKVVVLVHGELVSGGRNQKGAIDAPFDASSVDNMRRLAEHSGVPGHIYPLTLMCHDIMPPPLQVCRKRNWGERLISFHGTGLSVAPEMKFHEIAGSYENPDEAKEAYTQAFYNSVVEQYNVLNSAIHGNKVSLTR